MYREDLMPAAALVEAAGAWERGGRIDDGRLVFFFFPREIETKMEKNNIFFAQEKKNSISLSARSPSSTLLPLPLLHARDRPQDAVLDLPDAASLQSEQERRNQEALSPACRIIIELFGFFFFSTSTTTSSTTLLSLSASSATGLGRAGLPDRRQAPLQARPRPLPLQDGFGS